MEPIKLGLMIAGVSLTYMAVGAVLGFFISFGRISVEDRIPIPLTTFAWPVVVPVVLMVLICRYVLHPPLIGIIAFFDDVLPKLFKKEIHRDQYGILYSMPSRWGDMMVVRVEDSTGVYWIPVPPGIRRAKEGVAWTYEVAEESYDPVRV